MPLQSISPPPDYSHQLDAIVAALKHTSGPAWLYGTIVGWVLGLASVPIVEFLKTLSKRRGIRQALYREMVENYHRLSLKKGRAMLSREQRLLSDEPIELGL